MFLPRGERVILGLKSALLFKGQRPLTNTISQRPATISAKWYVNLLNSLSKVQTFHRRQTDRPCYGTGRIAYAARSDNA